MEWHGKENGKVCNHIVKRCNSVIKQPQKKAKSWNGSKDRWQYPTQQPKNNIIEQATAIRGGEY